jgi:hypothetical protein
MKLEVKTYAEMEAIVNPLLAEKKFVIHVRELAEAAGYIIEWIEHKNYVAHGDGKEYPDEIWMDVKGEMHLIQDLEAEHCRNIIRMMLRNEREDNERTKVLRDALASVIESGELDGLFGGVSEDDELPHTTAVSTSTGKILH